jgi:hypothetical protein
MLDEQDKAFIRKKINGARANDGCCTIIFVLIAPLIFRGRM